MKLENARKPQRGVVLIVVVGVLAILSLLAATFGMIARVELAASRNQTEYEMARQAAQAGSEYLINALASWLNGSSMTSGALPTFLPNSADTDGQLLYKRDGVKVYLAINNTVPTGSVTPDWLQGLGLSDAGMFNINAMGCANDLGSNCNPDIRCTSFDCSLVRLLTARFSPNSPAPQTPTMSASDMASIDAIRGGAYPSFTNANEQQRVAILLAQAIINWRHGPDGVPGTAGTEERRLGHLPRWNSKFAGWPWTNPPDDVGVGYPAATGNKYDWGWGDGFPSLYVNWAGMGSLPLSYFETGIWRSYGTDLTWGNDVGLPFPGLFWGKVIPNPPGPSSTTTIIYADTSQPGWRDWPASTPYVWANCNVYFATGPNRWQWVPIQTNNSNSLTLAGALPNAPNAGDAFCIFTPQAYVGQLNKRWNTTDPNVEGDLVPNALLWPNGTLATEGNVMDLVLDSGIVSDAENLSTTSAFMADTDAALLQGGNGKAKTWTTTLPLANPTSLPMVVHIYGGVGRGQVRTIASYTDNTLTLLSPWTVGNIPTSQWWTPPPPGTITWTAPTGTVSTSNPCLYRIELLDNNLPSKFQPNNLQGDDRLYLSLGDCDSVVIQALVTDGLSSANAQAMANILLPYFQPYLSVSTQAIQASQSLCSINDWGVDGVDNDANGVVDDPWTGSATQTTPTEPQYEQSSPQSNNINRQLLAKALYNKLGLSAWAHVNPAQRIPQAAQLVANIIDFRDPTDVPTLLTPLSLNETTSFPDTSTTFPNGCVYGAKGLHVTQVMPSPDAVYSTMAGAEMTNDGGTGATDPLHDMAAWDWRDANDPNNLTYLPQPQQPPGYPPNTPVDQPCWQVMGLTASGANPTATFTFNNLIPGYYALRLIGGPQNTVFTVTYPVPPALPLPGDTQTQFYAAMTTPDPDTTYYSGGGPYWYTGFVRNGTNSTATGVTTGATDGSGALTCFQVVSIGGTGTAPGSLTFTLQAPVVAQFRGFALCAQYIQLTNISAHDILLNGWTVATDQSAPTTQTLPGTTVPAIAIPTTYTRAADSKIIHTDRIHGAVVGALGTLSNFSSPSTATFPINYGTYVICMCEEAYERQWAPRSSDPDYNNISPGFNGAASTNGDGLWGDERNEVCTLFPYGDYPYNPATGTTWAGATLQNAATMALLLGVNKGPTYTTTNYKPAVMVNDVTGVGLNLIAGNLISATQVLGGVDGLIPPINPDNAGSNPLVHTYCYSSIEKNILLQPTWDSNTSYYWAPCWNPINFPTDGAVPTQLVAYQNVLTTVPTDPPRNPTPITYIRTYLNRNYNNISNPNVKIWSATPVLSTPAQSANPTLSTPTSLATWPSSVSGVFQNRVFPIILNRPYPTTGWLGLVPTSNTDAINGYPATSSTPGSWRTIDPNPNPPVVTGAPPNAAVQATPPATPEQLLGTLMSNATVGGVYARFNINTAPVDTLKAIFPDATALAIVNARMGTNPPNPNGVPGASVQGRQMGVAPAYSWYNNNNTITNTYLPPPPPALANYSWTTWDELLNDPLFQYAPTSTTTGGIGFYDAPETGNGTSNADAGAGTYADGFPDNSNEKKEWFMRFSNLFCLQSTSFQFVVAGLVYKDQPWDSVTMQNNEPVAMVRIEVDVDLSNPAGPSIVHFRYLAQQ